MIEEDYVSYEVAKLLKEKGFDETCYQKYDSYGELAFNHVGYINDEKPCDDFYALAPTHQMAMKWLRVEHKLSIEVSSTESGRWIVCVYELGLTRQFVEAYISTYVTYEVAVEAALKYCLTNLI